MPVFYALPFEALYLYVTVYSIVNWARVYSSIAFILVTVSGSKTIHVIIYHPSLHKNELDYSFYDYLLLYTY